jgi:hypothetical protein
LLKLGTCHISRLVADHPRGSNTVDRPNEFTKEAATLRAKPTAGPRSVWICLEHGYAVLWTCVCCPEEGA